MQLNMHNIALIISVPRVVKQVCDYSWMAHIGASRIAGGMCSFNIYINDEVVCAGSGAQHYLHPIKPYGASVV